MRTLMVLQMGCGPSGRAAATTMIYLAFRYGNLEMSNLSVVVIAAAGVLSLVFFVVASLNTDTQGLIDSAVQKFDDDDSGRPG